MKTPVKDTGAMISGMNPVLRDGQYVFVTTGDRQGAAAVVAEAIAVFQEDEGISLILPVHIARKAGFRAEPVMRCITLRVFSSLEGVGLTAAVATALAAQGIPCNMVAAYHHDHAFVPDALCDRALDILKNLQSAGQG